MGGRITVPIRSEFGDVIGIAVRSVKPEDKGWWNTSFDKAKNIFLFDKARKEIYAQNKAYIFEGYMDGICLSQEGLWNSVVMMGTNLGLRKISLISRYCDRICLCFDNDPNNAGLIGQLKTLSDLNMLGFTNVSKINMPTKGTDPDEFVLAEGLDSFLDLEVEVSMKELKESGSEYLRLREANKISSKYNS
jgi:DNA primase